MKIEIVIRNHIEKLLTESWKEVMMKCSQEEINDLEDEYNEDFDKIISDIVFDINDGMESLKFLLDDVLYLKDPDDSYNPSMIDDSWLNDYTGVPDIEEDIEYEGIPFESNINEDFKY